MYSQKKAEARATRAEEEFPFLIGKVLTNLLSNPSIEKIIAFPFLIGKVLTPGPDNAYLSSTNKVSIPYR